MGEELENKTGALVFCGSTAWDWIGRRNGKGAPNKEKMAEMEYSSPHVYGPAAYINVQKVFTHCTSAHAVLLDDGGHAFTFGRNDKGQLGDGSTIARDDPFKIELDEKVVFAATGRGHTILVTESGKVFGAGDNKLWQALGSEAKDPTTFTQVDGLESEKVVSASCGIDFTIVLTEDGKLFGFGSPQFGQLGDGSDHSYIGSTNRMIYNPQPPKEITGIGKRVLQVASGSNHSHCLVQGGSVYSWGSCGYGRLGLNESPPKDTMVPAEISGFGGVNPVERIAVGPTCGMLIDSRGSLHLWGKWKNSGDGGQGTPWLYPKYFSGLSGWSVTDIAAGGTSLFALSEESTISWGQGCVHGEMGHGPNRARSATNAVKVDDLEGFRVMGVACGLGNTLLIVDKDDAKFEKLPVLGESVTEAPVQEIKKKTTAKRKATDTSEKVGKVTKVDE
ncbi:regulator of chromosome condensation 1/beta-lactamase-inhibitor protein II [Globomyces pollinis-pini]|nr:regulator of chromosome condensation 1/beta-lactamase-inhibitor protein II [Globomyces pollinis-pini]